MTLVLALGASASAQQLPAVYQNYLRAAIQTASPEVNMERAQELFAPSDAEGELAWTAQVLLCQQFGQAWMAVQPKVATTKVASEAKQTFTVAEFTEACQEEYTKALQTPISVEEAKKRATELARDRLFFKGGEGQENSRNEERLKGSILDGELNTKLVTSTLELGIILQRFPDLKTQGLGRNLLGSELGTGTQVQTMTLSALNRLIPSFQGYAQRDTAPTVNRVVEAYSAMLAGSREVDTLIKAKRYDEANIAAIRVSSLIGALGLPADRKELLSLGITQTVSVGGKAMPFNSAVNAMYDFASQASTRARAANTADRQQAAAAAAAWSKASAIFKGDRARVYKLVGVPSSLSGKIVPSNSNVAQSAKQMAGAERWYYSFRLRDGADSLE